MNKPRTSPAQPADRLHLLPRHRKMLVALLREHLPGIEVWAYGSRVNGRSHDGSDLDLVLRSRDLQEIPIGQVADLREALRESKIPFLVEARDWARLPESFHPEIEREYVVLLEGSAGYATDKRQEIALCELVEIYDGPHATPKKTDAGPIFLGISNLVSGRLDLRKTEHLSEEDYKRWTQRVTPEPGDIVFSYETRLGEAAHIPTGLRCCLGRRMGLLRPKGGKIDARFLLYAFLGERFQEVLRSRTIHGSTVNRIPLTEMGSFPIEIPTDLSEQRAIAHILGPLDDKIELNRRMNETLEAMARTLFKSWFVDFDPVHAKAALKRHAANPIPRRGNSTQATKAAPSDHSPFEGESWRQGRQPAGEPVGRNQTPLPLPKGGDWTVERAQAYLDRMEAEIAALFPDSFAASESGKMMPEGWAVSVLGDGIEILSGGTPKTSVADYWDGDIPWYTARDAPAPSDVFVLDTERKITETGVARSAAKLLPTGTTIITARGTVGRLACLGRPMSVNQTCYGIRGVQGYPDFFTYLRIRTAVDDLQRRTHGTIFDTITRQTFSLIDTVIPPSRLAEAFEMVIEPTMRRILSNRKDSRVLAALRDTLLPKFISGEIRVCDAIKGASEIRIDRVGKGEDATG